MKDNILFDDTDDMTLESISQDFPILSDEERERIYAMSNLKYINDKKKNSETVFNNEEDVKGVEKYNRPKFRTASIAVAAAFIIGAGSFGGYNIAKQLNEVDNNTPEVTTDVSEDIMQSQTETAEDPRTEEYRSTAETLLAEYNDFCIPYNQDEIPQFSYSVDIDAENMTDEEREAYIREREEEERKYHDHIWFELRSGTSYEPWTEKFYGGWYYDHFETGMQFSSTDEVMEKALSFMSRDCIDKVFPKLIGEELSGYETDRIYDYENEEYPDFGTYAMYNGKLYCNCERTYYEDECSIPMAFYFYNRKDEPIIITDIYDDSFTACVKYDFTSIPDKYDMTLKIAKHDGNWIIEDMEPTNTETDPLKNDIVDKMLNSCDKYDNISAKSVEFIKCFDDTNSEKNKYSVNVGMLYSDNRTPKEYSYTYYGEYYGGEESVESMMEYGKNAFSPYHEKTNEDYCDGENYYFWQNPSEGYDGWYDWNNHVPHGEDAERHDEIESLRIGNDHKIIWSSDMLRPMYCPNGASVVTDYLYDFSTWDITGEITYENEECYIIDFNTPDYYNDEYNSYYRPSLIKWYVSKETGVPLSKIVYDQDGIVCELEYLYDVHFNDEAEPVPEVDMSRFDMNKAYFK